MNEPTSEWVASNDVDFAEWYAKQSQETVLAITKAFRQVESESYQRGYAAAIEAAAKAAERYGPGEGSTFDFQCRDIASAIRALRPEQPKSTPMSPEEWAKRKPDWTPDHMNCLQDPVHKDTGKARPAKAVRPEQQKPEGGER